MKFVSNKEFKKNTKIKLKEHLELVLIFEKLNLSYLSLFHVINCYFIIFIYYYLFNINFLLYCLIYKSFIPPILSF